MTAQKRKASTSSAALVILIAALVFVTPGIAPAAGDESYIGSICLWPLDWAPRNWMLCQGQTLQITQYSALYSILGITYGGNGTTTFALPDLRGKTALGVGQGKGINTAYTLGKTGGSAGSMIVSNQLPIIALGAVKVKADIFSSSGASVVVPSEAGITAGIQSATLGGTQTHDNMQPYMGMNYIICINGYYPSRN